MKKKTKKVIKKVIKKENKPVVEITQLSQTIMVGNYKFPFTIEDGTITFKPFNYDRFIFERTFDLETLEYWRGLFDAFKIAIDHCEEIHKKYPSLRGVEVPF